MPELPDIQAYVVALRHRIAGQPIRSIRLKSPFLLRSLEPPLDECVGAMVEDVRRIGKQVIWQLTGDRFLVFHLMIAGRLFWREPATRAVKKHDLLSIQFEPGTVLLTEVASQKRASLHVVRGRENLAPFDRGGLEVLDCSFELFAERLGQSSQTLKRWLTDPSQISGVGNAFSDEILCAAGLSPFQRTGQLDASQQRRLFDACRETLGMWIERLVAPSRERFPEKVTPFRDDMLVHGRFKKPCGRCGAQVQRIVYREKEFNYCPRCQTEGRVLADRSLSRLLKGEWPPQAGEDEEDA